MTLSLVVLCLTIWQVCILDQDTHYTHNTKFTDISILLKDTVLCRVEYFPVILQCVVTKIFTRNMRTGHVVKLKESRTQTPDPRGLPYSTRVESLHSGSLSCFI